MVAPGEQFQYELPLAANHPGGTFWIHPHMHGAVAHQLSSAGSWMGFPRSKPLRKGFSSARMLRWVPVEPSPMAQMTGREGSLITASGNVNPTIAIQKDGWVRLRLINASCSRFYRLQLGEHALYQIATDGGSLPAPIGLDELLLLPGQRAGLMIQG